MAGAANDETVLLLKLRAAIFGNTQNDGVVRLQSQWGGLSLAHTTTLPHVLHSYAPRYPEIQNRVVELLRGSAAAFAPEGFPPAGRPLLDVPPDEVAQTTAERRAAIAASGMVASHAEAFSQVARHGNLILVTRPVNCQATALIANGAATKGMHVKGKSADWGPQAGFIAVEQRFSKLGNPSADEAKRRDNAAKIPEFDREVRHSIEGGWAVAVALTIDGQPVQVCTVRGPPDREQPLVRRTDGTYLDPDRPDRVYGPQQVPGCRGPLRVLADPVSRIPLTADYDLLAIGTREPPGTLEWDDVMGAVNAEQKELIALMNHAVRIRGKYTGGNVVHHGPETQYTFSRPSMVDFPLTAFEPDGTIRTIEADAPPHRWRHVKRYFALQRRAGWHLEPNRRWLWEWDRPYTESDGYHDQDPPLPPELAKEFPTTRAEALRRPALPPATWTMQELGELRARESDDREAATCRRR
jgi:hypothetical protein